MDLDQETQREFCKADCSRCLSSVLPAAAKRHWTSLTLGIDAYLFMLDYEESFEIPDEAVKSVTLKWENEKWER